MKFYHFVNKCEILAKAMSFFIFIILEIIPNLSSYSTHLLEMSSFGSYKHRAEDSSQIISSLEENNLLLNTFY